MAAQKGKDLLIKIADGVGFTTVAGLRTRRLAFFAVDEATLITFNGSVWGDFFSTISALQNLTRLGLGTSADATNPFSAKLNNALWVAKTVAEGGDGDLRYKLSKEGAGDTASMLFQDNFSGRAEIGLTGDDSFHFKVSPDGSTWTEALMLNASTGQVNVQAASASTPALCFSGDADTGVWSAAADTVSFSTGGAERVRLSTAVWSAGANGVTNPALQADFSASSAATGIKVTAAAAGGGVAMAAISSGANENVAISAKGTGSVTLGAASTGDIALARSTGVSGDLSVSGSATLSGNVAITAGQFTLPINALAPADITAGAAAVADAKIVLYQYGGSPTNWAGIGADGSGNVWLRVGTSVTKLLIVKPTGMLMVTGYGAGTLQTDSSGNVTASSDERLKRVTGPFMRGLADLKAVGYPVLFQWRHEAESKPDARYVGFLAQHVRNGIPEAVNEGPDGMLTLSDRAILATVVNGLLELDERLTRLESAVAS